MSTASPEADERRRTSMPDAYWLSGGSDLTLFLKGRARARADTWFNVAEIYGPPRLFPRPASEHLILPLSQVILDAVETQLALPAPAPILDRHGRPVPGLRSELAETARYHRDKLYLDTPRPDRQVVRLLNEAHADLNRAAVRKELSRAANEARFHCAEALRVLESAPITDQPYRFPRRAAVAVMSAVSALDRDAQRGTSTVLSFPFAVYAARLKCGQALEYVEKNERDRTASRSRSVRTRRKADPGRER